MVGHEKLSVALRGDRWRGGRVVDGSGLENRRGESLRGFESHPLRYSHSTVYQALQGLSPFLLYRQQHSANACFRQLREDSGRFSGTNTARLDKLIAQTTKALNDRGIRGSLKAHRQSFYWRGYFTNANGRRAQKQIHIGLKAHQGQLLEAERRVIELAVAVDQ